MILTSFLGHVLASIFRVNKSYTSLLLLGPSVLQILCDSGSACHPLAHHNLDFVLALNNLTRISDDVVGYKHAILKNDA